MDFAEMKRKKERGVSNEEFMDQAKDYFKDADCIVTVGINSEGLIETLYTHSTDLQAIGMMKLAKEQLIDEMEA